MLHHIDIFYLRPSSQFRPGVFSIVAEHCIMKMLLQSLDVQMLLAWRTNWKSCISNEFTTSISQFSVCAGEELVVLANGENM